MKKRVTLNSGGADLAAALVELLEGGRVEIVIRPTRTALRAPSSLAGAVRGWAEAELEKRDGCYLEVGAMRKAFIKSEYGGEFNPTPTKFGQMLATVMGEWEVDHHRMAGTGRSAYMGLTFNGGQVK